MSVQHVGNRYTQPGDQEAVNQSFNFIFFDPATGAFGESRRDVGSLRLPAYNLVNLSAGVDWDRGLEVSVYVNNLLDENPLLSFDRERGGRARQGFNIGQPRTIGLTLRQSFGSAPPPLPALVVPPPAPAPAPPTQTCADGSVILASDACPALSPPPLPAPAPERG